jgi:hypothetical protein
VIKNPANAAELIVLEIFKADQSMVAETKEAMFSTSVIYYAYYST